MAGLATSNMNMNMNMNMAAGIGVPSVAPSKVRFNTADYRKLIQNPPALPLVPMPRPRFPRRWDPELRAYVNLLDAANAARAISYAVENGAHVINASWHVGMASQALFDAIVYAASQEVVFVAAAGNEGLDNDQLPTWPASYTALPNVISVMASNRHDEKPGFSNYGDTTVHLAAPGVGVLSTQFYLIGPPRYRNYGGTSAAAAHAAAAAALVKALAPAMTAAAIRAHIMVTADRRRFLRCVARGRLNLARAVCTLA